MAHRHARCIVRRTVVACACSHERADHDRAAGAAHPLPDPRRHRRAGRRLDRRVARSPACRRSASTTSGYLRDEAEAVAFFEATVPGAAILLVKLHGGVRSLPGFADLVRIAERERAWVVAMPGTDDLDPELTAYSTAGIPVSHEAKAYFQLGGLENVRQCLYFLSDHLLATGHRLRAARRAAALRRVPPARA